MAVDNHNPLAVDAAQVLIEGELDSLLPHLVARAVRRVRAPEVVLVRLADMPEQVRRLRALSPLWSPRGRRAL